MTTTENTNQEAISLSKIEVPEIEILKQENKNMKEALDVIRFLAFKHEVAYWDDASGTDAEKLDSILVLAREANWAYGTTGENKQIKKHHLK